MAAGARRGQGLTPRRPSRRIEASLPRIAVPAAVLAMLRRSLSRPVLLSLLLAACGSTIPTVRSSSPSTPGAATPTLLLDRMGGVQAMAWLDTEETLMVSTAGRGLQSWSPGGVPVRTSEDEAGPTSLVAFGEGFLGADALPARVSRFSSFGKRGAVLAASFKGDGLSEARSLSTHVSGTVYLIDRGGNLLVLTPTGHLSAAETPGPALAVATEGDQLVLALEADSRVCVARLDSDGLLATGFEDLFLMGEPVKALCSDRSGGLLLAMETRVEHRSLGGQSLRSWEFEEGVTSIAAGAPGSRVVYVSTEQKVFRIPLAAGI